MADDLESLFRRYRGELQRIAYRSLRDREGAADVVQDAFVRYAAYSQAPGSGAAIGDPRRFLWRVVGNLVIDVVRRRRRHGEHAALDGTAEQFAHPGPSPEQALESRQQLRALRRALAELPPNCRAALLLNRLDGLTHSEVAARLGVSSSMVSKYIMQALRHCAKRLRLARPRVCRCAPVLQSRRPADTGRR
ncbi:MAG: sigma-70 family RNA polymerase sigma factor [Alphaproteobacteria bacterium]|nr:sigma-70 family RNA polymerase sigma factor [Alphaproteobacteria bacterium]